MSRPDIKLALSDIDGTILPQGQRVVSERMRAAMHAAMDAGMRVGPASGRGIAHVVPTFGGDDACMATALATNGMQVYLDGALVHEEYLPREALEHVCAVIGDMPHVVGIVFDHEKVLVVAGSLVLLKEHFPFYGNNAQAVDRVPSFPIVKMNIVVVGDEAATRELRDLLAREVPELGFNIPIPGLLNLTPAGYSKATGIDLLCEAMGIGLDQVVVFGDSGNDLEMLAHVPNSVAVANATPEAAAAAHWHIGSCEDEAVADVLIALARGDWPFAQ